MNPDTAPIAEVEAWLIGKTIPYPACLKATIGPSMDAAIACLPDGATWTCSPCFWSARLAGDFTGFAIHHKRSMDPAKARDELLRLAAKAWMKMEEGK